MNKEVFGTILFMLAAAFLIFYFTSCQEQTQNKNFHPHTQGEIDRMIESCRPICQAPTKLTSLIFDDDGTIHCNCE